MRLPPATLPHAPSDDHGELTVYRLWHPADHTPTADALRTFGPLFRFDPHPEHPTPVRRDDHPPVWYGGEALETALREVLDRGGDRAGPRVVEVCARQRMAALRLTAPTELLDLTAPQRLGADEDLGDRPDTDYAITRTWARAIHDQLDVDGLRYHSARHRHPDGRRAGVNICLWSPACRPQVISDVNATRGGAWRRLHTILDAAGAAPVKVHGCHRCKSTDTSAAAPSM